MFLGPPLSEHVDNIILEKVGTLKVLNARISYLQVQDTLLLLQYSLTVPKFLYLLRTAPCFQSSQLHLFDGVVRGILSSVGNIPFCSDDRL